MAAHAGSFLRVVGVGAGSAWRRHAPTPGTRSAGRVAGGGHGASPPSPWSARRPPGQARWRGMGAFGAGGLGVGGRGGPGRPGGRRPGCGGSGGAPRRAARSVRRLPGALGRPRGGRGRRWRPGCRGCGSTPTAGGCAGRPGRWRPGRAPGPGPPGHSGLPRRRRWPEAGTGPVDRCGASAFQPLATVPRDLGQRGVEIAAGGPLVGVAGGVAAGWGDHIAAPAPPVHMLQPAGLALPRPVGAR